MDGIGQNLARLGAVISVLRRRYLADRRGVACHLDDPAKAAAMRPPGLS